MAQRRQTVVKVLVGLLLAVLAGLATIVIKDTLARQTPENALPVMDVYYYGITDGQRLSEAYVRRDRYEWRFLFSPESGGGVDLTVWEEIHPAQVNPGALIELDFTYPPKSVKVSMMNLAQPGGQFEEVVGEIKTPSSAGKYAYKVEASWETYRWVQYYFVLQVPDWA